MVSDEKTSAKNLKYLNEKFLCSSICDTTNNDKKEEDQNLVHNISYIEEFNKIINKDDEIDLEDKLHSQEQTIKVLEREICNKNNEIKELKLEMEKYKFEKDSKRSSLNNNVNSNNKRRLNKYATSRANKEILSLTPPIFSNKDEKDKTEFSKEELLNLVDDLYNELETITKEKDELQENALERILEKEMEIIEMKNCANSAMNYSCNYNFLSTDGNSSCDKEELKEILLINELKQENLSLTQQLNTYKNSAIAEQVRLESIYNSHIHSLENEISSLKADVHKLEAEKAYLEKLKANLAEEESYSSYLLEESQNKYRLLKEEKNKQTEDLNFIINEQNKMIEDYISINKKLKKDLEEFNDIKKKVIVFAVDTQLKTKENNTVLEKEVSTMQVQNTSLNNTIIMIKSEKDYYKKAYDKVNSQLDELKEKFKLSVNQLNKEVIEWKEKYYENEDKLEKEKEQLRRKLTCDLIKKDSKKHILALKSSSLLVFKDEDEYINSKSEKQTNNIIKEADENSDISETGGYSGKIQYKRNNFSLFEINNSFSNDINTEMLDYQNKIKDISEQLLKQKETTDIIAKQKDILIQENAKIKEEYATIIKEMENQYLNENNFVRKSIQLNNQIVNYISFNLNNSTDEENARNECDASNIIKDKDEIISKLKISIDYYKNLIFEYETNKVNLANNIIFLEERISMYKVILKKRL